MTPEQIHARVARQAPEAEANMIRATGVMPLKLERWIKNPKLEPMDEETMDALESWCKGEFAHCSTRQGYIRVRHGTSTARALGVKPPRAKAGKKFPVEGNNFQPMPILRPARKGADLPAPDALKLEAARKREAEQKKPKRNPITEVMKRIVY